MAPLSAGEVVVWSGTGGSMHVAHAQIPRAASNIVALAAGSQHTLALRDDGRVFAWGRNSDGQCAVPAGLSNVVALAGGDCASYALLADGTVTAWGTFALPPGLTGVRAISCGSTLNAAVLSNGTVVCWDHISGEPFAEALSDVTNAVAVAAGLCHVIALKDDGTVTAWGWAYAPVMAVPQNLAGVKAIAVGQNHSVALLSNGTVRAWGIAFGGPTNIPPGLSNVVGISARSGHSLALTSEGKLVAWGNSCSGKDRIPPSLEKVSLIAAGDSHFATVAMVSPALSAEQNYDGATLCWPNMRLRYVLEQASSLTKTNWLTITNLSPQYLPVSGSVGFFRLRVP